MPNPQIVVLDGHDAAGKSTIAGLLADRLGGRHVKPFDGSLGDMIAWLSERSRFGLADRLAQVAVQKVLDDNSDAQLLVFDRHWLSMFTVLPEKYYSNWFPLPPTVLCWTDPTTTCRRLRERGEQPGDYQWHVHYCKLYRRLAKRLSVPMMDTTDMRAEEAVDGLLARLACFRSWKYIAKTESSARLLK